jgi:hypothetical protein
MPESLHSPFHALETLAPLSPAAAVLDLAVHRRSSSSYVWKPAEVLYVQHFDDRIVGLHCCYDARHQPLFRTARLLVILVASYLG